MPLAMPGWRLGSVTYRCARDRNPYAGCATHARQGYGSVLANRLLKTTTVLDAFSCMKQEVRCKHCNDCVTVRQYLGG